MKQARDDKRVTSKDLKLGRFLGQGCSGIVYEATWESGGSNMPILARKAFPAVPADVFEYEAARLVDLVDHPNVVKVLGWTVDRRSCSLVMEHMKYDLLSVVEKRKAALWKEDGASYRSTLPIPLREAVNIMLQIATGVQFVHENGLVHGDLKPGNVLVNSETGLMLVKVVDFGLFETKKRSTALVSHRARCLQILTWKAPELFENLLGSPSGDPDDDLWTKMPPDLETVESSSLDSMGSGASAMQRADVYSFALTCSYILGARVPQDSNVCLLKLRNAASRGARPRLPDECPKTLRQLILNCWRDVPSRRPAFGNICEELRTVEKQIEGAAFMVIDGSSISEPSEDHDSLEMVMKPIAQVSRALATIEHVCTMSAEVYVNKRQCKRLADRFSGIGEGLKGLGRDKHVNGNDSDSSDQKDYPAFDELLTVLRKGEALVSSYVDAKGIASVITNTENRESFEEIHKELDTLKAQFDFESFSESGLVKDFESSSGVERTNALAEDADQDLTEMPRDLAQIKHWMSAEEMDLETAARVVMEKSGLLAPKGKLPSYLEIDPAFIEMKDPVRPLEMRTDHINPEEFGWPVVRIGKWIGCDFAAKVFSSSAEIDKAGWNSKQLLMEVGSLANMRHPHIVRLVGFGHDAEKFVFLVELMDADLESFMEKKLKPFPKPKPRPFERSEELDIMTQIANGMCYIHAQQYVHRDLKCSNILVKKFDDFLEVKIADLRASQKLGRVWDAEAFKEASKARRPRWTAPELIDLYGGKEPTSELWRKADVYSFGMTCFEVLTGRYPFDGIIGDDLPKQIYAGVRPELPGDLDEDLKGLIQKCWDSDPVNRPEFGEIVYLLNYIRSKKPVVVWNRFLSKNMLLGLMKKIHQVPAVVAGLLKSDSSQESSVWGEAGSGWLQRSDSALAVPQNLRIQPDKLVKVRLIGKGHSATVYEATWLGCKFAVKVFNEPTSPLNVRALQQEVDILINLCRHPCIVQMVGLSVDCKQRCSIVMEFMEGDLRELIYSRVKKRSFAIVESTVVPFELHETLAIISKIALGMAFLHSKGVVHRDLKCGNVLFSKDYAGIIDVKLADFGFSQFEPDRLDRYFSAGTGFWRAPEVFPEDKPSKIPDLKAADVYSFAMMCYEVLTGKVPFAHLRRSDYAPVIAGERPLLPALLHPPLKALVEQCWHADPVMRPNFTEICEELQKIRKSL